MIFKKTVKLLKDFPGIMSLDNWLFQDNSLFPWNAMNLMSNPHVKCTFWKKKAMEKGAGNWPADIN